MYIIFIVRVCIGEPEWALWGLLMTLSVDFIFSIICLILFIQPLYKLAQYAINIEAEEARKFEFLVRKYCTLVCVAVISSLTMLFVAAAVDTSDEFQSTLLQSLIVFDNLINVICMFLLSHTHNRLYGNLCYVCIPNKMKNSPEFSKTRVVSTDTLHTGNTNTMTNKDSLGLSHGNASES